MAVVCKIFVGGGFDDKVTHIVENYHARYAQGNPSYQCHYFPWTNESGIAKTVGHFRPTWTSIRGKCQIWPNVRAEPSGNKRTFDDTIAWMGGKYPRPPAPGQAGAPNYAIIANATHGAFSTMMAASGGGMSGRALLGGRSVG